MNYDFTPEEAVEVAEHIAAHYSRIGWAVAPETTPWPKAPYRTTICARRAGLYALVEAQGAFNYSRNLKELAAWLAQNRSYAEMYIAVDSSATIPASSLAELRADSVGLLLVDRQGVVALHLRARNHALVVTPEPTLRLGSYAIEVGSAIDKFNDGHRKDAVRDMCELVERLTDQLGSRACAKGWLKTPGDVFSKKDWESQINELARSDVYIGSRPPLVDTNLKNDLLSFKGARNLVNHKAKTAAVSRAREIQFVERMMQGPRLISDMLRALSRIR